MTNPESPPIDPIDHTVHQEPVIDGGPLTEHADLQYKLIDVTADTQLAYFGRRSPDILLPSTVQALSANTIHQFDTGFPLTDEMCVRESNAGRLKLARSFTDLWYQGTIGKQFVFDRVLPARPLQLVDNLLQMRADTQRGIACLDGMSPMILQAQLLYGKEAPLISDEAVLNTFAHDIVRRGPDFTDIAPPAKSTFEDMVAFTRTYRAPDLSRETLDARCDTFTGILSFSLANEVLQMLAFYATFGSNKGRQAVKLTEQFKAGLLADDVGQKLDMLEHIAGLCETAAPTAKDSYARQCYVAMQQYMQAIVGSAHEYMYFFTSVYHTLGYEVPPQLQEDPEDGAPYRHSAVAETAGPVALTEVVAAPVPAEEVTSKPETPPEIIAEVRGMRAELEERIDATVRPWRLSKKKTKELGLEDTVSALKAGVAYAPHVEGMGDWALAPLSHDYTVMILGSVIHLSTATRTAKGSTTAEALVAQYSAERQELMAGIEVLQYYANEQGCGSAVTIVRPPDVAACLQYVSDNWHVFRRLFDELGLDEQQPGMTGNIWQVLPEPRAGSNYAALRDEYEHRYDLHLGQSSTA